MSARVMVAGKPKDLYDNLASSQKAGKSRDRAIAKESRATLTGSLLERLIAATTLNRIAPSYTHVLQDQIGAGEKTYTMAQRGTQLDARTGNRLRERVDRSRMGTERVRPAYMGEGDIMMDPYVKGESVEGLAGQGYTGYTGTFETGFGDIDMDVAGRNLSFSNPMREPYSGGEVLGAREARQTAQLFGYGGGSGGVSGGGRFVMASGGEETEGQRIARVMIAKGGIWDDMNGRFVLPNTREFAAVIARQTQSLNPFESGAYEMMYGAQAGGGAAFNSMDGGGILQEEDEMFNRQVLERFGSESQRGAEAEAAAYSSLGQIPERIRPIPSDELLAIRSQFGDAPLAQEEREAFRQYLRANPSRDIAEFRNPRVYERMVPSQPGSLEQLDPSTPMTASSSVFNPSQASSASTRELSTSGSDLMKIAQQERRGREREVSLLLTGMIGELSGDPELARAVAKDKGYSFTGLSEGKVVITKKPKRKDKEDPL